MPNPSIKVSAATRTRLLALGKKGESYDVIITRLLDEHDGITSEESPNE